MTDSTLEDVKNEVRAPKYQGGFRAILDMEQKEKKIPSIK
jgi:hypothetical protein